MSSIQPNKLLFDFYQKIEKVNSFRDCFQILDESAMGLGFDGSLYTFTPIVDQFFAPIMLISEQYGKDYLDYYQQHQFAKNDLILSTAIQGHKKPLNWFEFTEKHNVTGQSLNVMDAARTFGLRNGISFGLFTSQHIFAGASFVCRKNDDYFNEVCLANVSTLQVLAEIFHYRVTYKKLHHQPFIEPLRNRLNSTKIEILKGLKDGMNTKKIASNLGISDKYVQNLVIEIKKDFNCVSRDQLMFLIGSLDLV